MDKSKTFCSVKESGDLTFEQPVEGIGDTQYDASYKCISFFIFDIKWCIITLVSKNFC